jgi:hypothetical protein
MTTTEKTLMTDKAVEQLRVLAQEAERGALFTSAGVRYFGECAIAAADTIAALTEQNVTALRDVDTLRASRNASHNIVMAVANALDCSTSDGAIQEALEALQRKAESLAMADATVDALEEIIHGAAVEMAPSDLLAKARVMKAKAQRWDAAQAAGALEHSGLLKAYNAATDLSFEGGAGRIVAHVRANDAANTAEQLRVALQDNDARRIDLAGVLGIDGPVPSWAALLAVVEDRCAAAAQWQAVQDGVGPKVVARPAACTAVGGVRVGDEVSHALSPSHRGVVTSAESGRYSVEWLVPYINIPDGSYSASVLKVVKRAPPKPGGSES